MLLDIHADPLLGVVLEGRYRLLERLGHGGMGTVYLAEDTRLGRRYALKVLNPALTADSTYAERFLREAQTIARLQHPNIVDIHTFGSDPSGVVFFTMELLIGSDLAARVAARSSRPYTAREACGWAAQVARAIAAVHRAGLIHRDLKPQNIFVTTAHDGQELLKLLDFGIARSETGSELTNTGVALGTPSYMSPEQCRNEPLDRRSDIYSFGVVMFHLLTGELPFRGDAVQVAVQHCTMTPRSPSMLIGGISHALDDLVLSLLAKDPAARPKSMEAVEQSLLHLDHDAPPVTPLRDRTPDTSERALAATVLRPQAVSAATPDAASGGSNLSHGHTDAAPAVVTRTVFATLPPTTAPPLDTRSLAPGIAIPALAAAADPALAPPPLAHVAEGEGVTSPHLAPVHATATPSAHGEVSPVPGRRMLTFVLGFGGVLALAGWLATRPEDDQEPPQRPVPTVSRPPSEPILEPTGPMPPEPTPLEPTPPAPTPPETTPPETTPPEPTSPGAISSIPPASDPPGPKRQPGPRKDDPIAAVKKLARKCRKDHDHTNGPSITISYGVGADGSVLSASAVVLETSDLARCLVNAVKATKFPPVRRLGQRINL